MCVRVCVVACGCVFVHCVYGVLAGTRVAVPTSPHARACRYVVRLYVLRGIKLTPADDNGKADPYVVVSLGKNKINGACARARACALPAAAAVAGAV